MNDIGHDRSGRPSGGRPDSGWIQDHDPFIGIHCRGPSPPEWPALSDEIDIYLLSERVSYNDLMSATRSTEARAKPKRLSRHLVAFAVLIASVSIAMWFVW